MLYKFGAAWLNLHVVSGMKIARNMKSVVRCFWNNGASIHPSSIVTPPVIGHIFRLFRYAYPSGSLRCSRKRPSLLSLACASGRLSFAVGERYYCVYFLSAISFTYVHPPTPHSILRFRPAPQTPDLRTSNLPLVNCCLSLLFLCVPPTTFGLYSILPNYYSCRNDTIWFIFGVVSVAMTFDLPR